MITLDNIKQLLLCLGYSNIEDRYIYHFDEFDCDIEVDFIKNKIIYPEDKGLVVNERQTCNLSDNENFVVLECVHRLLLKGYKPSHIEIEKRWTLGHSQKSGRADICIMNETGSDMLAIIECKTYGAEFDNALKNLKNDGGQLFSYYQQEQSTKWLMLYATGFLNNEIIHQVHTISTFDTKMVLDKFAKNKSIKLFEDAHSKEKAFEVWKETYEQKLYGDLIFLDDTIAYNIGEKPLRKKDLKEFNPRDKIVYQFEEILRHNNVSDKENAFNKLVALFICKLVDEITKKDNDIVDFQYKYGTDTYETLLDRLQRLYKEGMDKFMKEEIFYVSSEYPVNLFSNYKGHNRKNAINDLKETFRKLKFYSNNDFAFKEVHNEELFLQNSKILVEVVKLFENYKIVYTSKHQFLGDLFEQLLNKGFKQNEGQFFTPLPITRFIWESLPIEYLMKNLKGSKYPKVIDYACGSGHFLTEGIDMINSVVKSNNNNWVEENIYGVEKDYRLARVSKISLFMNGAGGGNIIFGDGLDNHKDKGIFNNHFDILVANPPYSIKAFKSHLKLEDNGFEILDVISNDGGEIEVLFVERISQLLKAKGIAAVILPSAILSNSSNSYIAARESIIKNFKIKVIVQLGDKTFGATGTNTVILFLEKHNEPPKYFDMIMDSVSSIFNNQLSSEWIDSEILNDYLKQIDVEKDSYIQFINESANADDYKEEKYFKVYYESFIVSQKVISTTRLKSFEKLSDDDKNKKINSMFFSYAKEIEMEKLLYFALVREENTLVIKAPKGKAQQEFLGYKWSDRTGSEGIQILNNGGILFDEGNRENKNCIAPLVRKFFLEKESSIEPSLVKYVSIFETKNMFDFEREKFDKAINLIEKKSLLIDSKYMLKKLGEVCTVVIGGTPSRKNADYFKGDNLWVSISEMDGQVIDDTKEKITLEAINNSNVKLIPKGTTLLSFKLSIGKTAKAGKDLYTNEAIAGLIPVDNSLLDDYIYYLFRSRLIKLEDYIGDKAFGKSLNSRILKEQVKIPIPPIKIQKKIIEECKRIERTFEETYMKIESNQMKIQEIFSKLETEERATEYSLNDTKIFTLSIGKRVLKNELSEKGIPVYSANVFEPVGFIEKKLLDNFEHEYIIWGIDGDWMVNILPKNYPFYPTDHCGFMFVNDEVINPRYMAYLLEKAGTVKEFSRNFRASLDRIRSINISVPNIDLQNNKIEEIKNLEMEIEKLKKEQIDMSYEINKIVAKYIN